jgi:hypothetical protein
VRTSSGCMSSGTSDARLISCQRCIAVAAKCAIHSTGDIPANLGDSNVCDCIRIQANASPPDVCLPFEQGKGITSARTAPSMITWDHWMVHVSFLQLLIYFKACLTLCHPADHQCLICHYQNDESPAHVVKFTQLAARHHSPAGNYMRFPSRTSISLFGCSQTSSIKLCY